MKDGSTGLVTTTCQSFHLDGWRQDRGSGGLLINAVLAANVATDLSMPRSPCFYQGKLWFCKSATGAFSAL